MMINNIQIHAFVISLIIVCGSCRPQKLNKQEMVSYIRDKENGLIQTLKVGEAEIEMLYNPTELLFIGFKNKPDNLYFNMKVNVEDKSLERYLLPNTMKDPLLKERINFKMEDYICLISPNQDTIRPLSVMKNDLGPNGKATVYMIVFKKGIENENSKQLDIVLKEFGAGIGTIHFKFNYEDIKNIPQLI